MTILATSGVAASIYSAKLSNKNDSWKKLLIIAALTAIARYAGFTYLRNCYVLSFMTFFLLSIAAVEVPKEETLFVVNAFRRFFALALTVGSALAAWLLVDFNGLFLVAAAGYFLGRMVILFFEFHGS